MSARTDGRAWSLAALPGVLLSLLPCVACPGCWPAYAAVLGSFGLGALMDRAWLLPLACVALALAALGLAFRARSRRGYGPALVGGVAAVVILAAKFALESDALTYAGVALLGAASVWNAWPRASAPACESCACPSATEETT